VIGVNPVFVAVKEDMFPVPLEGIPIFVFELVHVYEAVGKPGDV
jgi:hypothetical protein